MAPIPDENAQHTESQVWTATEKTISKFVVPEIEKKVHEIEQTEADCKGSSDLEFFVETIRIQDRLNYKWNKKQELFFINYPHLQRTSNFV